MRFDEAGSECRNYRTQHDGSSNTSIKSMTWPQLITLPLTILLVGWLARRARRPAPVVDGWHFVRYPLALRAISTAGCVAMLTCGSLLIPSILEGPRSQTSSPVFGVLVILLIVLFSIYGMLFTWRNWVKYNEETLISGTTWKRPQTFRLAELRFTGAVGPRGHQYKTHAGDTAYVNTYQQGASQLIEILSRR
jgi:hypothetical protein